MSNGHPIDHANGQQPGLSVTERAELERLRSRLPFPMEAVTSAGGAWSIEPNVLWIGGCDPEESASLRDLVAAANAVPALLSALSAAEALLTEARAWGEEQRRQASEHYERAETAEAARASLDLAVTEALKDRDAYERGEREAREALRECREAAAGGDAAIRPEQTAAGVRALAAMVQEGLALRARMRTVADHLGDLANLDRRSITSIRSAYGHAQELVLHALLAPATTKETP